METIIPAEFLGTPIDIIDRDGQKWLTAEQVGRCLGYDPSNARKGVLKIFERHGDEFSAMDTFVVKLTANPQGGNPTTRIFSATGCIKLGFFSNTPRAKEFRAWASTVLAGRAQLPTSAPSLSLDLARELGTLRDELRAQNGLILDLYRRLDAARCGHIAAQRGQLAALREAAAVRRALEARSVQDGIDAVLEMEAAGVPRDEIARATGKTRNYIRQIIFRARNGRAPDEAQGELALEG